MHLSVVKYLIQKGANVHAQRNYALRRAACNGHLSVVKSLISSGANVHAENDAALQLSAERGHLPVVKFLVKSGAYIHANNNAALRWSSEKGHLSVVNFLLNRMQMLMLIMIMIMHYIQAKNIIIMIYMINTYDFLKKENAKKLFFVRNFHGYTALQFFVYNFSPIRQKFKFFYVWGFQNYL